MKSTELWFPKNRQHGDNGNNSSPA